MIELLKAIIKINNKPIVMEVDSNAYVILSVLFYNIYRNMFKEIPFQSLNIKLKLYNGSIVTPVSKIFVTVNLDKRFISARLL